MDISYVQEALENESFENLNFSVNVRQGHAQKRSLRYYTVSEFSSLRMLFCLRIQLT